MRVDFTVAGRRVEFDFTVDPSCVADINTASYVSIGAGMCEPEVAHVMARTVREGDFVVDVGANVGFFTCVLSRLVGPTGLVLAVEPGPNNLSRLPVHVGENHLSNVEIVPRALWYREDKLVFHMAADGGLDSLGRHPYALGKVEVEATTLDRLCGERRPRFVKIDVEGAEQCVLEGGRQILLGRSVVVTAELNEDMLKRLDCDQASLRRCAADLGFSTFALHSDGSLPRLLPESTRVIPSVSNRNVLFASLGEVGHAWPELVL